MVKNERTHLSLDIRPKLLTTQSMFTVALTFIFLSLYLPYTLHNRICTRGLKKSINVMLEKKGKRVLTSNLQTICLIEEDFNFNKNILARYLMKCAEISGNAPKEKYGIRKEKIHHASCQQKTALRHDTLTTET